MGTANPFGTARGRQPENLSASSRKTEVSEKSSLEIGKGIALKNDKSKRLSKEEGEEDFKGKAVKSDSLCLSFHSLKKTVNLINNSLVSK